MYRPLFGLVARQWHRQRGGLARDPLAHHGQGRSGAVPDVPRSAGVPFVKVWLGCPAGARPRCHSSNRASCRLTPRAARMRSGRSPSACATARASGSTPLARCSPRGAPAWSSAQPGWRARCGSRQLPIVDLTERRGAGLLSVVAARPGVAGAGRRSRPDRCGTSVVVTVPGGSLPGGGDPGGGRPVRPRRADTRSGARLPVHHPEWLGQPARRGATTR
jgi:hypothetical protein